MSYVINYSLYNSNHNVTTLRHIKKEVKGFVFRPISRGNLIDFVIGR